MYRTLVRGTQRNDLAISFETNGIKFIGTHKEALDKKDVGSLLDFAAWHGSVLCLQGKILRGDFRGLAFAKVDMSNIDAQDAVFDGSTFSNVSFRDAWMFRTSFRHAHMKHIYACGAMMSHADFRGAHLHNMVLDRTNMFRVKRDIETIFGNCNTQDAMHFCFVDF